MSKSFLMSAVAAALLVCGIVSSSTSSAAKPAASRSETAALIAPAELQLRPPQVDCRFVACASDFDCAISPCSANSCSNPLPGQAFGRCTVRPQ